MGQSDVYMWLMEKKRSGDEGYYTVKEIREGLKATGTGFLNVDLAVSQLFHYGVLEVCSSNTGWWKRRYRIKAIKPVEATLNA